MKKLLLIVTLIFTSMLVLANDGQLKALKGGAPVKTGVSAFSFGHESFRDLGRKTSSLEVMGGKEQAPVVMKAGDGTTIYGELVYSDLWNVDEDGVLDWGVWSFPAQANTSITKHHLHTTLQANGGGAYHNGKLYFTSYYEGPESLWYLYFCILDVNTWKMVEQIAIPNDQYSSIGLDMTYDPVSKQLYSVAYVDETGINYTLSTMNIETGKATAIASIDRMSFIACDVTGTMYGVRYSDGMFCKVNKETGALTAIGSTGITPKYIGTGTFDDQTGKLYWTTTLNSVNEESGLYEIDIKTGKATLISNFPNNEMFTCLYIPRAENEYKLSEVSNFTANFDQTSTGTISVTAPSTDIDGNAISGNVTVVVYDNDQLLFSLPANPGETITQTVTLANGAHKLEAMAIHATAGKSQKKEINIFIGTDGPAAVGNLTLTKNGKFAMLTWDTPTTGAHGGTIKPNLVYYNIYRQPDNKLVAEDVDGNSWQQFIETDLYRNYYYEVVGFYKGVEGATAVSNKLAFGEPRTIPYSLSFNSMDEYMQCIIYNANHDSGYWGWYQKEQCAAYSYDTFNQADDYLLIPAVKFEAGQTYKLRFKAKSYGGFLYPERMEVKMGKGQDINELNVTLIEDQPYPHDKYQVYEAVIENINETGAYFIAFHATTPRGEYILYLDDIQVLNGPAAAAPGLAEEFTVTPAPNATLATKISFTAPTKSFSGDPLNEITKITVYRDNKEIKSYGATTPGTVLTFDDNEAKQGFNTYKIICSNSHGDGNPIEVKCWAGIDISKAPTEALHTTENGTHAIVTWVAPTQGVNGGSLDYSKLTYTVTRNDGVTVATGLSETRFVDTTIDTTEGQVNVFYEITAVNAAGTSAKAKTHFLIYGAPYTGEYHESFKNGAVQTKPWVIEVVNESMNPGAIPYWQVVTKGANPVVEAQDGDNGLVTCTRNTPWAASRIISPKLQKGNIKNPVLSFWMHHYYNPDLENGWSTDQDIIQPEVFVDGKYTNLTEKPLLLINGKGWYKYEILLNELVDDKVFQIAFCGTSGTGYNMHLDNIAIIDVHDIDMKIANVSFPERLAISTSRNIEVTVYNQGAKTAKAYEVALYRNGELFKKTQSTKELAFGQEELFTFEISANIMDAGKDYSYQAEIIYLADEDNSNNKSQEMIVSIPAPQFPPVVDLNAQIINGKVELTWSEPASPSANEKVVEGFENFEAFTISNFNDWTLFDNDALETYGISNSSSETGIYEYPNACLQMAFMAFNPLKAGISHKIWTPFCGNQMAVAFASVGGQNNDWLISPRINGGQTVSFYAKTPSMWYGEEPFYFCYSTTDSLHTSFKPLSDLERVPYGSWVQYSYTLPEDAKFFAINYVGNEQFALLIDDIEYESMNPMLLELQGFNVYRNNELITPSIVEDFMYTDETKLANGKPFTYRVSAIYDKGESALSNEVTIIGTSGINELESLHMLFVEGNILYIKNAEGKMASVNAVNGINYYQGVIENNIKAISLHQGVYAVTIDGETTKIVIK